MDPADEQSSQCVCGGSAAAVRVLAAGPGSLLLRTKPDAEAGTPPPSLESPGDLGFNNSSSSGSSGSPTASKLRQSIYLTAGNTSTVKNVLKIRDFI